MPDHPGRLRGDVFLLTDSEQAFAASQIELLRAVDECGSISRAAKQVGISYKTAWDRIDAMNNLASQPMVTRSAGGAKGGGTALTDFGRDIVRGFQALREEHRHFIERLGHRVQSINDVAHFLRSGSMVTSARNQFRGTVTQITPGTVDTEVTLSISRDQSVAAIITQDSLERLDLAVGATAVALVKASSVILSTDTALATSARNKLTGPIVRVVRGAVNSEVTLDLGDGKTVCAVITNISVEELDLEVGQAASAIFKASSVILLKDD
ncbi:TOBE domain-containing protein [Saccharospirillum salsuginis]|uniref:ModE family transcriptional regulator n=1 Tax=Saccharospirillum salsuginis TaxID=418750 RepID=A0A918N7W3_9GAMM|nr:TOBE domain-containing protein [Saccharospirillum salsuginis]GGX48867.1 ModE family transcriptional regulator [Saccharospirillum salsuginis]